MTAISPLFVAIIAGFLFFVLAKPENNLGTLAWLILIGIGLFVVIHFLYKTNRLGERATDFIDKYIARVKPIPRPEPEIPIREIKPRHMATQLKQRVIGQDRVIDEISRSIAHRFKRPRKGKPIYTLFVSGPTGVGKTELAKATAEFIFGDESHMYTVNVNTLPGHGISTLIGSPTGYAGGRGALVEHLENTPETLILFDELEKAGKDPNAEIYKMLLTLLDEGYVASAKDQTKANAERSIIILTANAAHRELSEIIERHHRKSNVDQEALEDEIKRSLADYFAPEFLARLDLITTLDPLSDESIAEICVLNILKLAKRYKLELDYVDPKWLAGVVKKQKPRIEKGGMRELVRMLERQLVDYFHDAEEEGASKVRLNFEEAPESKDGWRLSVEPTEWESSTFDDKGNNRRTSIAQ